MSVLPDFHGKLPPAEEQGPIQNLKSKPKCIDPNAINKRNENCSSTFFFLSYFLFLELHVILGLCLDLLGSIICGYSCARIIQFILTDLFSNTLTSVILCISMVYMTFYIGKAETDTKKSCPCSEFYVFLVFIDLEPSCLLPTVSSVWWPLCVSCHIILLPPPTLSWSLLTSP